MLLYCEYFLVTLLAHKIHISSEYFYIFFILLGIFSVQNKVELSIINYQDSARGYYSFFTGILLGRRLHIDGKQINNKYHLKLSALGLITSVLLLFQYLFTGGLIRNGIWLSIITYPSIIVVGVYLEQWMKKKFHSNATTYDRLFKIGSDISYHVYVWHYPILTGIVAWLDFLGFKVDYTLKSSFAVFLILIVLIATFSNKFQILKKIEKLSCKA